MIRAIALAALLSGCALHTSGTGTEPAPSAAAASVPSIPAAVGSACTPITPEVRSCPFGVGRTVPVDSPADYCLAGASSGLGTAWETPAECLCAETFTCACIAAHATLPNLGCGPDDAATCSEGTGAPVVTCAR